MTDAADAEPMRDPTLAEKVRFLAGPAAYPDRPRRVRVVETHMSFVFLAGRLVYKLKKPVVFPYLDFSTPSARRRFVGEELRLNRRLAPDVYLGEAILRLSETGSLTLDGAGRAVDWLVMMRRLPHRRMLDAMLKRGAATPEAIGRVGDALAGFYGSLPPEPIPVEAYLGRLAREHAETADTLREPAFGLTAAEAEEALRSFDARLALARSAIESRVREGRIVEGHGDLRPEHVCMTDPVAIIDRLEFDRALRLVDPFEEVAFLGLECARLGAPWAHAVLTGRVAAGLGAAPTEAVAAFHWTNRALLRARLALAHLREPHPRTPRKWRPLARRYLALAQAGPP
jgi:aminoglycoside phosphotransferase family enzyme